MGPYHALLYVAGAIVVIILAAYLAGCCRSRKVRPGHEERITRLDNASRRFKAGQIGERELEDVRRRALSA